MSDKSLDQINIPAFFNKYYVREVFTIEETIALSFDIDPDKICFSTEGIHDGQEKYYPEGFQEEYYKRLEIVREAVLYDNTLHDIEQEYVLFYIQQKNRWPKLWPLKAVELCKKKLFPFSVVLEKLITDYYPLAAEDLEVKYQRLEKENRDYIERINYLEKEVSPAHGNSLYTCYRIILLALREAYDTGNCEIKEENLEKYITEFITSIESLRDNADIKLPFSDIPHAKTINSTFQDMKDKFYKHNKQLDVKHVK